MTSETTLAEPVNSPPLEEDDYNESEDDDFNPDSAKADENASSDDEDEDAPAATAKPARGRRRKIKKGEEEAEDIGFENSGDEAIVKRGFRRKRKQGQAADEDSGGEGGFVKTRRMRAAEVEERSRKPLATNAKATVDVNALWAQMNDPGISLAGPKPSAAPDPDTIQAQPEQELSQTPPQPLEDLVEIEETYKFAGTVHTTKKLVARTSEEAQKWLKTHPNQGVTDSNTPENTSAATANAKKHPDTGQPLLRPLRRVSLWDPNPQGIVRNLPSNVLSDTTAGNKLRVVDKSKLDWHTEDGKPAKVPKATKLNVVEKSKMDWVAHVDAAGDKEELQKAAKAKGSYLERRDFLERVEARKDDQGRSVKLA